MTSEAAMQTVAADATNSTEFTPQQIKQLVETLFPLFLDSMEKHIEDTLNSLEKSGRMKITKCSTKLNNYILTLIKVKTS